MLQVDDDDDGDGCDDRGKRDDIDEEDDQESYFRYMEENPTAGLINDDDDNIEYDEDGNAIIPEKKVFIFTQSLLSCCQLNFNRLHCLEQRFSNWGPWTKGGLRRVSRGSARGFPKSCRCLHGF